MSHFSLDIENIYPFIPQQSIGEMADKTNKALEQIHAKTGPGDDFLGWVDLPGQISDKDISQILETANRMGNLADTFVITGIGGSYLGARAVIEALSPYFPSRDHKSPEIIYAGHHLSGDYLAELLSYLEGKNFGIVVISKSGTTTEPAVTFRFLKNLLEKQVGADGAARRIIAITDAHKGALRTLAGREGYQCFVIPDNVGGRYSVLTPVGLIPIALAGLPVEELVAGACEMEEEASLPFNQNASARYAAARYLLYREGKKVEILANYEPRLHFFSEWWKQLFGESEGKDHKGIFPASIELTTDLHSLGQYIQDGERHLFETVISIKNPVHHPVIPEVPENLDNLNYIAGKELDFVNKQAELGTRMAHVDGGVPNIRIEIDRADAQHLGQLIYFFEKACAISGYLLGINPFNQPGVEAYKRNMFMLLGKPGYEGKK
ncbi:MAG: glucose-6-phosphate isomerase [Chlorobi bacterium]|nr:glucose-6-phosphate isomerase [Chlorobiota bacterium]